MSRHTTCSSNNKMRFKSGDKVIVIIDKHKGKIGNIKSVMPKIRKVTVDEVNLVKKN